MGMGSLLLKMKAPRLRPSETGTVRPHWKRYQSVAMTTRVILYIRSNAALSPPLFQAPEEALSSLQVPVNGIADRNRYE